MAFSETNWQGSWPGTRWQVLGPQRQVAWCHCCLNRTDAEAVMAVSVKDVFPMSCFQCWWIGQSLHYLWEARTLTESQEKEGLMLVVCLYSCPIVEILEGSGMLDNSSQKFTPRVQVFHQTHFFASSSSRNIAFIWWIPSGLGLPEAKRVGPLPLGCAQPCGMGKGLEVEGPLKMGSHLRLPISPRGQL